MNLSFHHYFHRTTLRTYMESFNKVTTFFYLLIPRYLNNNSLLQNYRSILLFFIFLLGMFHSFFPSYQFLAQPSSLSSLKENKCCVPILLAPMSIDDNGDLLISWADNRTGNWEVFFTKSTDNGKTFEDSINISNSPKGKSENVEIISNYDDIYITFWDNKTGEISPYFVSSGNGGQTFSEPLLLNISNTNSNSQ